MSKLGKGKSARELRDNIRAGMDIHQSGVAALDDPRAVKDERLGARSAHVAFVGEFFSSVRNTLNKEGMSFKNVQRSKEWEQHLDFVSSSLNKDRVPSPFKRESSPDPVAPISPKR